MDFNSGIERGLKGFP